MSGIPKVMHVDGGFERITLQKLAVEHMRRFDRDHKANTFREFIARCHDIRKDAILRGEHPKWRDVQRAVRESLGFDCEFLKKSHNDYVQKVRRTRYLNQRCEERMEMKMDQAIFDWQQSLKKLPTEVRDLPPDLAWIYQHPAMGPQRKPKTKGGDIELTESDLIGAPSGGAANMLAHYVNRKPEFFKLVLGHFSKKDTKNGSDGGNATEEGPSDWAEIDALMKEFHK